MRTVLLALSLGSLCLTTATAWATDASAPAHSRKSAMLVGVQQIGQSVQMARLCGVSEAQMTGATAAYQSVIAMAAINPEAHELQEMRRSLLPQGERPTDPKKLDAFMATQAAVSSAATELHDAIMLGNALPTEPEVQKAFLSGVNFAAANGKPADCPSIVQQWGTLDKSLASSAAANQKMADDFSAKFKQIRAVLVPLPKQKPAPVSASAPASASPGASLKH